MEQGAVVTDKQRIHLMAELWPDACEFQGWQKGDRERRLDVLSQAVGRTIKSANDLNQRDDFDAAKRHLLTLAGSVPGAMRDMITDESRRTLDNIRELLACMELYVDSTYVAAILRDISRGREGVRGPEDLGIHPRCLRTATGELQEKISELDQFRLTLAARLNGKTGLRNKAGHSLHDMRLAAGLTCACSRCVAFADEPARELEEQPF